MKWCDASRTAAIASLLVLLAAGCANAGDEPQDRRSESSAAERRAGSVPRATAPRPRSSGAAIAPSATVTPDSSPDEAGPGEEPDRSYSRQRTVACLQKKGARVGSVRDWDERRTAFADLAQANSVEVSRNSRNVLMAFTDSPEAAAFLVDTLRVPDDPYRLEAKGSVVLLYRPEAIPEAATLGACLR